MSFKKRRKSSRFRGTHTHGRGFKKKARGSGHRGGFGMSGTGKRGDQKKTLILNLYGNTYFGKDKAIRRPVKLKNKVINLDDLERNLISYVAKGIAKDKKGSYEVNLEETKILGDGKITKKLFIVAHSASKSAIDKIKKAGGSISVKFSEEKVEKEEPVEIEKKNKKEGKTTSKIVKK